MKLRIGIVLLLVVALASSSRVLPGDYYKGVVQFKADTEVLSMPGGVSGIVFRGTQCPNCRQFDWMRIGGRIVDSLISGGNTHPLEDSLQLGGIAIQSEALAQVLERAKARRLLRRFPRSVPGNTRFWDSVRGQWHNLPDFSQYYLITFDTTISADSVVEWLHEVDGLIDYSKCPVPRPDL